MKKRLILVVVVLFLLVYSVSAVTFNPASTKIDDIVPGKEHKFIVTAVSSKTVPEEIKLNFDFFSTYMKEYITMKPQEFTLYPGETQNIEIAMKLPSSISPQPHTVVIVQETDLSSAFEINFEIEGERKYDLRLSDVSIPDIQKDDSLFLDSKLTNFGNVIVYAFPNVEILKKDESLIGKINYQSKVQILPGQEYPITLQFFENMVPGFYKANVVFDYEGRTTNTIEKEFQVFEEDPNRRELIQGEILTLEVELNQGDVETVTYQIVKDGLIVHTESQRGGDIEVSTAHFEPGIYQIILDINEETEPVQQTFSMRVRKKNTFLQSWLLIISIFILLLLITVAISKIPFKEIIELNKRIKELNRNIKKKEKKLHHIADSAHKVADHVHKRRKQ